MAAKTHDEDGVIVIKKYANRRLYNTARSSYVTLENLAEMVREGQEFVVRDAKTGEDITRSVLTQIIFEAEAKGASMLPTTFLRQIISLYGDSLQAVVPGYLDASMDSFRRNQEEMRDQVGKMFGANPAMENFEAMTRSNMEMFQQAMKLFNPFQAGGASAEATPQANPGGEARSEELDTLKTQLADMQAQLDKIARKS